MGVILHPSTLAGLKALTECLKNTHFRTNPIRYLVVAEIDSPRLIAEITLENRHKVVAVVLAASDQHASVTIEDEISANPDNYPETRIRYKFFCSFKDEEIKLRVDEEPAPFLGLGSPRKNRSQLAELYKTKNASKAGHATRKPVVRRRGSSLAPRSNIGK